MDVFAGYIWVGLFPALVVIIIVCIRKAIEAQEAVQKSANRRRSYFNNNKHDLQLEDHIVKLEKQGVYKTHFYALSTIMATSILIMFYFFPGPPSWTQSSLMEASRHQLIDLPGLEADGQQVIGITDLDNADGSSYVVAINDGQRIVDVEVPVRMASTEGNLDHPQGLLIIYECSLQDYWPSGLWTYACTGENEYHLILPQEYDLREIPQP